MIRSAVAALVLSATAFTVAAPSYADDCVDFKWDVARERSLFAGAAASLKAGADAKSAPSMQMDRLYELQLLPQAQVTFAAAPGKKTPHPDSYAGLASFKIPAAGSYRVAIDMPFWIDVVLDGALIVATDFQGQRGCNSPHKIVVFELPGTRPYLLQLSGAAPSSVRLAITATPARKL